LPALFRLSLDRKNVLGALSMSDRLLWIPIALVLLLISLCSLNAQEFRSTLTGRVLDQTGAVIPGATVRATEINTNSRYDTVSNGDGLYTFPVLLPGTYELTAEAKGFRTFSQRGIQLNANTKIAVAITLELGQGAASVTVTADAPPLESVRASAGQSITSHELENLPLDGHTALDAEFLGFGVISQANRSSNSPSGNAGFATITMGGAAQGANEILLDGVPNIGTAGTTGRRPALLPPPDSISEVKTEAFAMDAASGGAGGGTSEMVSKGGTNRLHGALSEYNNNPALQATDFFVNATGGSKPQSRTDQWSAVVGGPVWIPKVFNGKNRAFFFFAYEGIRSNNPTAAWASTPTAAERKGDFSSLLALNNSTRNYTLYDPATAVLSGGKITRQAFPNNVIPQARLNPIATKFINNFMPLPNQPGTYDDTKNFGGTTVTKNPYHFFSVRGDVNLSDRNKLSLIGRESMYEQDNDSVFGNMAYINNILYRASWGGMADDVHIFSPTMVANWRLGFTRYEPSYGQASTGYDPTALGFPSYITSNATRLVMPQFSMTDYTGNSGGNYTDQPLNTFQFFNSYTKMAGQHTIKFGGELRLQDYSNVTWAGSTGTYTFDAGTWVKSSSSGSAPTMGGSLAQFLLGLPTSGSYNITSPYKVDSYYGVMFLQDDWHARSNLTFNMGLRWEHVTPSIESHDRQLIGFDKAAINKATAAAQAAYAASPNPLLAASDFNAKGGVMFASSDNHKPYSTPNTSFAPRFGVSWMPKATKGRLVVRSGIGIFYYNYGVIGANQPGYSQSNSYVATNDNYVTPATTLSNPFPSGILQPVGKLQGVNTYLGQSITFNNPNLLNQYGVRWNFDIQYQLSTNSTFEVAYIGNRAVNLTTSYDANAMPVKYLSTLPVRDQDTITRLSASVSNPFAGLLPNTSLNGSTTSLSNLLKPFPVFSGLTESNMNNGSSYFHQMAIKYSKRLSGGLQFFLNYSHSRMMARASYRNAGELQPVNQIAADDRPDYLVIASVYDLPFGRNRHFMAHANRVLMLVLGNWQIAGHYSYFLGAPLTFGNVIYYGGDLKGNAHTASGPTFDITRFNTSSSQQLANNYRTFPSLFNNARVDGMNNINLNVSKSFVIRENVRVQFRGESYNLCNRPIFGGPNMSATAADFGYVSKTTNAPRSIQLALRLTF
jgi:hypothetical protein